MFFEKKAYVARLSPNAGDNNKEAYVDIANIKINIQPASGELVAIVDGAYGQTYTAFTTYSGVAVGDQITVSGTNKKFIVRGVRDWNYAPIPHLELVLFESDE